MDALPAWMPDFREPPAVDRPLPFWSWNAELDEARIDAMAATFAAQGCGGVFIHPRPGLVTEYLSPRWFQLWRHAAQRCAALGMQCHIYDENSFPSGFAGGHVVSSEPRTAARFVRASALREPTAPEGRVLACADPATGAALPAEAWKQAAAGRPVLALWEQHAAPDPWYAGFAPPDISLAATGRAFLATTHAAYAREVGDLLGRTARLVFTDEPTLPRSGPGLPWSEELELEFAAEHGYALRERLALLFVDGPGHEAVRHDYRATLNRLVCRHFFKPVHDWCGAHGLAATGHVDEHLWPDPSFLPSSAAALRWMQAPGNDLLGFQFAPGKRLDPRVRMARLNLRELDAVRRQCGRERCLVETCGGGGYAFGPREIKPLEDWAMVLGVSLINPHLAHVSLQGARKYDWAQTLSDHSPWALDLAPHHAHVGRVVTALRRGTVARRVAVLLPTTSAWLHARPGLGQDSPLTALRDRTLDLLDALEAAGIDWDPLDETVLAELGRTAEGELHVGACAYRALVLPATVQSLESATLQLLAAAAAAGVPLHGEGAQRPTHVAGRPDDRPAALAPWRAHADAAALAAVLRRELPPQLTAADGGPLPPGLEWRRVETPEGSLFFLCNPWDAPISASLRLPGHGVLALDTGDGTARGVASRAQGDGQVAEIALPPGGDALWLCTAAEVGVAPAEPAWRAVPATAAGIAADHANVLVLDHAELRLPGQPVRRDTCVRLDSALWEAMGQAPGWGRTMQFRRTLLERPTAHLPGFSVAYVCTLDPGVDASGFRLGLELPQAWQVRVNGQLVADWRPWFDCAWGAAPVGALLRPGENRIELATDRFQPRHEIANAYLLGDFALRGLPHGFAISPPRPLALGEWRALGRPLAAGCMAYAWDVALDAPATALRVRLPRWAGASWRLTVDGALVARAGHGEDALTVTRALAAGRHRLEVVLASHLAPMMGPHHGEGLPGRWTWERSWEPGRPQPPGAEYRTPATGLFEPPEVSVR